MTINKVAQAIINLIVARGWELVRLEASVAQIPMLTIIAFIKDNNEITVEVNEYAQGRHMLTILLGYMDDVYLERQHVGDVKGSIKDIDFMVSKVEALLGL